MKKLDDYVRSIPDFPEPGIIFRDVTSIGCNQIVNNYHLLPRLDSVFVNFNYGAAIFQIVFCGNGFAGQLALGRQPLGISGSMSLIRMKRTRGFPA